jgi:hypothetical protein
MSDSLSRYYAILKEWKDTYGMDIDTPRPLHSNLARVSISCRKCSRIRRHMHRHHTGNDYTFACMLPERFAKRYIEFHPEDVEVLCNRCHKTIHRKTRLEISGPMWQEYYTKNRVVDVKWCRAYFYAWIQGRNVNVKRKRKKGSGRSSKARS